MANALQEQLLKAGLINAQKLKQSAQEQRKQQKEAKPSKKERHQGAPNPLQQQLAAAEAERRAREQALNEERRQQAEQKARVAEVRQLIASHKRPQERGDTPYHFDDHGTVKRLYLSDALRQQLVHGQLAIVKIDGRYDLVPAEVAVKIGERRPASLVLLQRSPPSTPSAPATDEADPYAAYAIPDDLIW